MSFAPPLLGDIVTRNAALFPERTAIVYGSIRRTHRAHAERVRSLASAWSDAGLRRGDRVCILATNCIEFLEAYGAAECGGTVIATVNWRLAPPEIAQIMRDVAPSAILFEDRYADIIAELRAQHPAALLVCIGGARDWATPYEDFLSQGNPAAPLDPPSPQDAFSIVYTSGTTGRPKGVVTSHRAMSALAETMASQLGLRPDGVALVTAPLFHIGARSLQLGQFWAGGTVVLQRAFDPDEVVRTMERERLTVIHMVPTMVQAVLGSAEISRCDVSSVRTILYAAAPMPVAVLRRAMEVFGPIFMNGYGQTEVNAVAFLHPHQHVGPDAPLGSVGQPHPRVRLRIADDAGRDVPPGEVGEILVMSDTVMDGYWNNSVATVECLRDGWVRTGDCGIIDSQGFLFIVDRKKDMIISGGENIYSREVEETLCSHQRVRDAAVIGVADETWGEAVRAFVVLQPDGDGHLDEAGLIAHCRTLIARYKCPKSIVFLDALPYLPSGKIDKPTLRRMQSAPPGETVVAPEPSRLR